MRALVGKPSQYGLPDPDYRLQPLLHRFTRLSGWLANRVLRGHFRWQTLPAPFTLRLEGLNVNAFEEFGAGEILRNFKDPDEPYAKVKEPEFRALFKKQAKAVLTKDLWHRDFSDCWVTECLAPSLVGNNFKQLGQSRGLDAVDAYFELACQYRDASGQTQRCSGRADDDQLSHRLSLLPGIPG